MTKANTFLSSAANVPLPASTACHTLPSVDELVDALSLFPRGEGGWIRETFRSDIFVNSPTGNRSSLASIDYILQDQLNFHLPKFSETWNYVSGSATVTLYELDDTVEGHIRSNLLGSDVLNGELVQYTVNPGSWYAARLNSNSTDSYALIGNQAGPGFEFIDWETGNATQLVMQFPDADKALIAQLTSPGNSTRPTATPEADTCFFPTSDQLLTLYGMRALPQGGYYKNTYESSERVDAPQGERSAMASSLYLIDDSMSGQSNFHRLQSDATWNFYFGATVYLYELVVGTDDDGTNLRTTVLGQRIDMGEVPQYTVKAGTWVGAEVDTNDYSYALMGVWIQYKRLGTW